MVYSAEAAQFHPLIHPHLEDLQVAADEASVPIELYGRNTALRGYTFQLINQIFQWENHFLWRKFFNNSKYHSHLCNTEEDEPFILLMLGRDLFTALWKFLPCLLFLYWNWKFGLKLKLDCASHWQKYSSWRLSPWQCFCKNKRNKWGYFCTSLP